jgi:hypothetical protein
MYPPVSFSNQIPENRHPQNRPFSRFRLLQPIKKTIRQPNRFKQAGFSPGKIGYSRFYAQIKAIEKNVMKSPPIRPVTRTRPKSEYA